MEPSGIQKSPSQQPSCVPMSQLDTKMDVKKLSIKAWFCYFSPDVRGCTLRGRRIEAHRWTDGSLCHAVISQPAAVSRSSHVAHHLSVQALRGGGAGAGGRTDGTLGHTEVSQPTVSVRPHVTAG